jgi:multiple sugar transport system substrate-binding protein
MIASSVGPESSKAAVPAAYPARAGSVTESSSPYAAAALTSIGKAPAAEPYPWTSQISNAIRPVVADVILGKTSVPDGQAKMQELATAVLQQYP